MLCPTHEIPDTLREPQRHVMLVLNFFDELRRLAPTN
jgi:hypothetical protein